VCVFALFSRPRVKLVSMPYPSTGIGSGFACVAVPDYTPGTVTVVSLSLSSVNAASSWRHVGAFASRVQLLCTDKIRRFIQSDAVLDSGPLFIEK
jgi:hypothetical protein